MSRITLILWSLVLLAASTVKAQTKGESLPLSKAIEMALGNGAALQQARADWDAAKAKSNWLSSGYLPRINSELSFQQSQYSQIVTPIRQQGIFPPLDDQIYSATIQADWTVFDFGEQRKARQAALALAQASNVKYELARMETIELVASDFILLHQFRMLLDVQRRRQTALESSRKQVRALLDKGRVARVDLLKVEEVLIGARADLTATRGRISQILVRLRDNLGMDEVPKADKPEALDWNRIYAYHPSDSVKSPMVEAAKFRFEAIQKDLAKSNRMLLPDFSFFASEQFRAGTAIDPIDDQWIIGIRMRVPLFQGKLFTQRQALKAQVTAGWADLKLTRQRYRQRLNELINAQYTTQRTYSSTQARLKHLVETYRIEKNSYRRGRTTIADLLNTEAKKAVAETEVLRQQAQMRLINLNMAVLTGFLTPELALKLTGGK